MLSVLEMSHDKLPPLLACLESVKDYLKINALDTDLELRRTVGKMVRVAVAPFGYEPDRDTERI